MQLKALAEIVNLTIEDPIIRQALGELRLSTLAPKYKEPNLLISTSRALYSVTDTKTHSLWSPLVLRDTLLTFYFIENFRCGSGLEESLQNSLT